MITSFSHTAVFLCIFVAYLCSALPSPLLSATIAQLHHRTSSDVLDITYRHQTPNDAFLGPSRIAFTHIRRGSGGQALMPVPFGSFQLQTKNFKTLTTILPATVAAIYIDDFLRIIALRIETGEWGSEAPANHRVINMWSFELSFQSLNTAIPWDFIQAYAIDLAEHVKEGFVATFEEQLTGLIGGIATAVTVKLRINSSRPPTNPT